MADKPTSGEQSVTEKASGTGPRVGMYDRPASADRKMPPLPMILAIVAVLILISFLAFQFLF